ncbi:MAG TPA: H-type small acid-soluble spore protein [Lachnospiraceae bacterium]|nr:H-type small acid-soluble spore protein [Lachnospiraceae bacterium]
MDRTRAKQISSSLEMANVCYNGEQVYIESVNPNKDTASIHLLNRPQQSQEVALTQIYEV